MKRVLQLEDLHHHGVGVREEQPHLREEPPHVEVVGLLHHELGELQRALSFEGREALPAVSGGPVLQLLPPGHADGPSSASPGEVVVGQLEKVVQHGADCVVLVAVPLVVREPQPQLLGRHVAAAADRDVAGRSRDGLARRLLLRYVSRALACACFVVLAVIVKHAETAGGTKSIGRAFEAAGWEVVSLDIVSKFEHPELGLHAVSAGAL